MYVDDSPRRHNTKPLKGMYSNFNEVFNGRDKPEQRLPCKVRKNPFAEVFKSCYDQSCFHWEAQESPEKVLQLSHLDTCDSRRKEDEDMWYGFFLDPFQSLRARIRDFKETWC